MWVMVEKVNRCEPFLIAFAVGLKRMSIVSFERTGRRIEKFRSVQNHLPLQSIFTCAKEGRHLQIKESFSELTNVFEELYTAFNKRK